MSGFNFLTTIIILYGVLQLSEGLECYVCNSVFNEDCDSGKPADKYLVNCTSKTAKPINRPNQFNISGSQELLDGDNFHPWEKNYTMCRKTIDSIPRQNNKVNVREGETRVFRSCGWEGEPINGCKWGAADGIHRKMCDCSEDKCNSANILSFCSIYLLSVFYIIIY